MQVAARTSGLVLGTNCRNVWNSCSLAIRSELSPSLWNKQKKHILLRKDYNPCQAQWQVCWQPVQPVQLQIYSIKIHEYIQYWSGWWFEPLWKIWKSIGMRTFPIYGKIKNVPNHQPVIVVAKCTETVNLQSPSKLSRCHHRATQGFFQPTSL